MKLTGVNATIEFNSQHIGAYVDWNKPVFIEKHKMGTVSFAGTFIMEPSSLKCFKNWIHNQEQMDKLGRGRIF